MRHIVETKNLIAEIVQNLKNLTAKTNLIAEIVQKQITKYS